MSAMPTVANHWLYRLLKSRSFMHQCTRDNWRTSTYETATQTCISPWKKRKHFFLIILASLVTVSWDQLRRKLGSPLWLFFNDLRFYNTCLRKKKNKRYACDVVMLSLPVSISFFLSSRPICTNFCADGVSLEAIPLTYFVSWYS